MMRAAGTDAIAFAAQADADHRSALTRRRRVRQIASVLSRHGLGYLLGRFGLEELLPFHKGMLGHPARDEPYTRPDHLRLALEQLGATAIKLGQILSTRADLLPPAYIDELAKLRDRVPPVPAAAIRAEIEARLGRPVAELFAAFDDTPLAAASIGQVHAATLPSGESVVVKVQKPGVAEQIDVDLRLLLDLARLAQRRSALAREYDLVALVEEFAWTLRNELDYEREGRNAETFRDQFAGNPDVVIPRISWSHTAPRVLTMQRLVGVKIDDLEGLQRLRIDTRALAVRSANLVLTEIVEHGFYHADPHPGNFLVLEGGVIGALDFGMVGRLRGTTKLEILDLMSAVVARDPDLVVDAFEELGIAGTGATRAALARDVGHLLDRYVGRPLGEIHVDEVTDAVFAVVRRHHLQMPADLVLLLKTLAMNEGVGRRLDPGFNASAVAAPFAKAALRSRLRPDVLIPEFRRGLTELGRVGIDLPGQVRRLTRRLDRGELSIVVRPRDLDEPLRRLDGIANRLILAVLLAAFVIGVSLMMVAYHPGGDDRWVERFFVAGLVAAGALGGALVAAVRRGSRR